MKTSQAGIDLIKQFEGLRLTAYPDPGTGREPYTIGYGTTKGIRRGMTITLAEAESFLKRDLEYFERGVERLIAGAPTSQSQFDAFVSFSYNCGLGAFQRSSILRHHRAGQRLRAAASFLLWVKAAGRTLPGLVRRRNAERKLYIA